MEEMVNYRMRYKRSERINFNDHRLSVLDIKYLTVIAYKQNSTITRFYKSDQ